MRFIQTLKERMKKVEGYGADVYITHGNLKNILRGIWRDYEEFKDRQPRVIDGSPDAFEAILEEDIKKWDEDYQYHYERTGRHGFMMDCDRVRAIKTGVLGALELYRKYRHDKPPGILTATELIKRSGRYISADIKDKAEKADKAYAECLREFLINNETAGDRCPICGEGLTYHYKTRRYHEELVNVFCCRCERENSEKPKQYHVIFDAKQKPYNPDVIEVKGWGIIERLKGTWVPQWVLEAVGDLYPYTILNER